MKYEAELIARNEIKFFFDKEEYPVFYGSEIIGEASNLTYTNGRLTCQIESSDKLLDDAVATGTYASICIERKMLSPANLPHRDAVFSEFMLTYISISSKPLFEYQKKLF